MVILRAGRQGCRRVARPACSLLDAFAHSAGEPAPEAPFLRPFAHSAGEPAPEAPFLRPFAHPAGEPVTEAPFLRPFTHPAGETSAGRRRRRPVSPRPPRSRGPCRGGADDAPRR